MDTLGSPCLPNSDRVFDNYRKWRTWRPRFLQKLVRQYSNDVIGLVQQRCHWIGTHVMRKAGVSSLTTDICEFQVSQRTFAEFLVKQIASFKS